MNEQHNLRKDKEMSTFSDNCMYIVRHVKNDYLNPYLKKIKGVSLPTKIWNFGNLNEDKVIYLITDISTKRSGFYSIYLGILSELSYAKIMGWIPVVDDTAGLLRKNKHRKNENYIRDFFQFDNAITIKEALESRNVILCNINKKVNMLSLVGKTNEMYKVRIDSNVFNLQEGELSYWREFASNNLKYKKNIEEALNRAYLDVIQDKKNVLSVAVREGKMALSPRTRRCSGERKQPSIQKLLEIARKYFVKWKCEYIYLSCESPETIDIFKQEFGENIILILERYRISQKELFKIKNFKSGDRFMKKAQNIPNYSMDYIKDMYILSKGDYLICPVNCGTAAAFIMNGGFKNQCIIDDE